MLASPRDTKSKPLPHKVAKISLPPSLPSTLPPSPTHSLFCNSSEGRGVGEDKGKKEKKGEKKKKPTCHKKNHPGNPSQLPRTHGMGMGMGWDGMGGGREGDKEQIRSPCITKSSPTVFFLFFFFSLLLLSRRQLVRSYPFHQIRKKQKKKLKKLKI